MSKVRGRNGKHKPGKQRIQIVAERETKAILVYTAMLCDTTLTDLLLSRGMDEALARGVVDSNGKITEEHANGVQFILDSLRNQEGDR